ncbi:hypothetical protein AB0G00_32425 [Nocardia salmonicida]|uniref:hypothetical protein n=1 Tax=Nocardia salmonicida TaxID=53431 RepID=UPI0033F09A4D
MTSPLIEVLQQGKGLTVYGIVNDRGECEAKLWLAALPPVAKVQFRARLERLADQGFLRATEEWRQLECPGNPPVHEIKVRSGYRLYMVRHGKHWVSTHGAKKPKDKKVCQQAETTRETWKESQR